MVWIQRFVEGVVSAMVVLYSTRSDWLLLFFILLLLDLIVTVVYARDQLRGWGKSILGYVIALLIFVAFGNAYLDFGWFEVFTFGSITWLQIDAVVTKLGNTSPAFRIWVQVKQRFKAYLTGRIENLNENVDQTEGQDGGPTPGK